MPSPHPSSSATSTEKVPWWLWPQVLALDAPLVALVWQEAMALAHDVRLDWYFRLSLALATWIIYVADRVMDGLGSEPVATHRHRFCKTHRRLLLGVFLPAAGWGLIWVALTRLPVGALWQGLALGTLAVLYLAMFAAPKRPGLQLFLSALATAAAVTFISQLPLPPKIKLGAAVVMMIAMAAAFFKRLAGGGREWFPREMFGALVFAQGCILGSHFWLINDHSFLCRESILLWMLLAINLVLIAAFEVRDASKGSLENGALVRAAGGRGPLIVALVSYGALTGWQHGFGPLDAVCAAALLLMVLVQWIAPERVSTESHHWLLDIALILPPLAWIAWSAR